MTGPLLDVEQLCKRFGGLQAVQKVCLHIDPGEIVALIGPNGAGKTTCFNCITGADRPTSGEVRLDGSCIGGMPAWKVAQAGIGRTFQNIRLWREMTVLDNVRTPAGIPAGYGLLAASATSRRGPAPSSPSWASRTSPTRAPASSPTAPSAASRSPARSRSGPASSCSTSPPPG